MTALGAGGGGERGDSSKKEKGLVNVDSSVVFVGGGRLNGNGKKQ